MSELVDMVQLDDEFEFSLAQFWVLASQNLRAKRFGF